MSFPRIFALGPIWRFFASSIRMVTSLVMMASISRFPANISAFHRMSPPIVILPPAIPRSRSIITLLLIRISPPARFTSPEALFVILIFHPAALISQNTGPCSNIFPPATVRSPLVIPLISIFPPVMSALSQMVPLIMSSPQAIVRSPDISSDIYFSACSIDIVIDIILDTELFLSIECCISKKRIGKYSTQKNESYDIFFHRKK